MLYTILDNSTSTSQTDFVQLPAGRYRIALSLASTDASVSIAIAEKNSGGTSRAVATTAGAVALTQAYPAIEYASSGELVAVTRSGGSVAATVTAALIERTLK